MELKRLLTLAWKRRWVVAIVTVLTVALSAAFAASRPARYESTATIALTPNVAKGGALLSQDALTALLSTYAQTAKSRVTLSRAAAILGRPLPGDVDTATEAGTGILRIIGRAEDPGDAAITARATADAFQRSIQRNDLFVARIIDPPEPDATPIQPRPPLIISVAAVLGLLAGLMLAFALETLRRRIETPEDIAELTPARIVGRLPRERSLARSEAGLIWHRDDAIALKESFRGLRTNLQFLLDSTTSVIEVTSPGPAQGKSTIVANLAVAISQLGIDTVVLDADLRRPRQHLIFDVDNSTGLSSAMGLGRRPEPQRSRFPNLWVVPSGPIPPDPTEMLTIRFQSVIAGLRELDAMVLVDTPPLLPVSDAQLIAPSTDGVLLVLAAGIQKPAALQGALDRLAVVHTPLLGLVLNRSGHEPEVSAGYYHYDGVAPSMPPEPADTHPR